MTDAGGIFVLLFVKSIGSMYKDKMKIINFKIVRVLTTVYYMIYVSCLARKILGRIGETPNRLIT